MQADTQAASDSWGIAGGYWGTDGHWHATTDSLRSELRRAMRGRPGSDGPDDTPVWVVPAGWGDRLLGPCRIVLEDRTELGVVTDLPPDLPIGRHRLTPTDGGPPTTLIVRPRRCHHPAGLRVAALAVQVYALHSRRSWGIGDLADVARLGSWAADAGIDLLALSPLHAATPGPDPQPSPYYPSSRRHLSPLLISVPAVPGYDEATGDRGRTVSHASVDQRSPIDRAASWGDRIGVLEEIHSRRDRRVDRAVAAYRTQQGPDLERWATYCAISEVHGTDWRSWPSELRHPERPEVASFARRHRDRISLHCWLQMTAERQLETVTDQIGIITDLAVGVDPAGADAWTDQDLLALGVSVGAPPDEFAPHGQDWGLPPYVPHLMRADGYDAFARTLRAVLRHADAIRIDHILGLFRTFWIPAGSDPAGGGYVRNHHEELLAVLAIESVRAGAVVIGEDLGTVEDGVRDALAQSGVLGTRLVLFEDELPHRWPSQVAAAVTTHDLPTIAGSWTGADAQSRQRHGLAEDGTAALRSRLTTASGADDDAPPSEVVERLHASLAASTAEVVIGNLDDVVVGLDRPNMPGTIDEWPNWRLRLPVGLDELVEAPPPRTLTALIRPTSTSQDGLGGNDHQ